jgi:hypothetical protein
MRGRQDRTLSLGLGCQLTRARGIWVHPEDKERPSSFSCANPATFEPIFCQKLPDAAMHGKVLQRQVERCFVTSEVPPANTGDVAGLDKRSAEL